MRALAAIVVVLGLGPQTGLSYVRAVARTDLRSEWAIAQRFEVASIKPCKAETLPPSGRGGRGGGSAGATTSPGRAHWECATVAELLNAAYAVGDDPLLKTIAQMTPGGPAFVRGGPGWVYSERYQIDAKAPGPADRPTMIGPMLLALLEDRFKLKTHREKEERAVYALTVGKDGPRIKATAPGDCHQPGVVPPSTSSPPVPTCGNLNMSWNGGNRVLTSTGVEIQSYADAVLSGLMDRSVVNRTGLEGRYNITLEFAPDDSTPGGVGGLTWSRREGATPATTGSVFRALESLGLKLEPAKAPAEYLVIDRIEKPAVDAPVEYWYKLYHDKTY